jgi:NADP-reducing hydrogenase subunit HndB
MATLTLEALRKLREDKRQALAQRDAGEGSIEVIIGMGTCGIAAGAKETFAAMIAEIDRLRLDNVVVKQTGCMGLCASEPSVEVVVPGMPGVVYGNVDADTGRRIVNAHIVKGELLGEHLFDKPAADIMK